MNFFRRRTESPSPDNFDVAIRHLLAKYARPGESVVEGDNDSLHVGDSRTNLGNLRQRWSELPDHERLSWLEASIAEMAQRRDDSSFDTARLLPGVRTGTLLANAPLLAAAQSGQFNASVEIPRQNLGGDLHWVLIEDSPHTMSVVNNRIVEQSGRTFDELFSIARENLAATPIQEWGVLDQRVFMPVETDDYLGARIFLPGGLDELPFTEDRVVFLPNRETALITSASDPEGIAMAANAAQQLSQSANPVSLRPLVGSDAGWRPLEVHTDHPAYATLEALRLIDELQCNESQKELLQHIVGEELFVSSYIVVEIEGRAMSLGTWSKGVPSLLPVTDSVALVDPGGTDDPVIVAWDTLHRTCGQLLEKTNHWPARWRVSASPDAEAMTQLRAAQLPLPRA